MNILKIYDAIDGKTYYKGLDYFSRGLISHIEYEDASNTFKASAIGTEIYDVTTTIIEGEIKDYSCTCPVVGMCKHVAGLLISIKKDPKYISYALQPKKEESDERLRSLQQGIKSKFIDELSIIDYFDQIIDYYHDDSTQKHLEKLKPYFEIGHIEKENQFDFLNQVYLQFQRIEKEIKREDLLEYIQLYISSLSANYKNNVGLKELVRLYKDTKFIINYIYAIMMQKTNLFIDLPIDENEKINIILEAASHTHSYDLPFSEKLTKISTEISKYIKNNLDTSNIFHLILNVKEKFDLEIIHAMNEMIGSTELSHLLNKLNIKPNTLKEALELKHHIPVEIDYHKYQANYKQLEELKHLILEVDKDNFQDYIKLCLDMKYVYADYLTKEELFSLIESFDLIDKEIESKYYFELVARKIIKPSDLMLIEEGGLPSDLLSIKPEFDMKTTHDIKGSYKILLTMNEKELSDKIIVIKKINTSWQEIFKGTIQDEILKNHYQVYIPKEVIDILTQSPTEETMNEYKVHEEKITPIRKKLIEEKNRKESIALVETLADNLFDDVKVLLTEKVKIKPIIIIDALYKNGQMIVDDLPSIILKIGQRRDYIVKDIPTFLNTIENESSFYYGKELSFYHYLEQFDILGQDIISIIETYSNVTPYKSYTAVQISDKNLEKLMNLVPELMFEDLNREYLGEQVESYKKIDDYAVKANISKTEFNMNIKELLQRNHILMRFKKMDILLDTRQKTYCQVSYQNKKQKELVHFILDHPNFNIQYVLDEFTTQVLPLIKNEVEISDELIKHLEKFSLKIESYFDYDRELDQISVEHKYFEDGKEIHDINKYPIYLRDLDNYENILEKFGFYDQKIMNPDEIARFITSDLTPIKNKATVYIGKTLSKMTVKKMNRVNIQITSQNGMLKTHIEQADLDSKTLKKVLKAYEEGKSYILLENEVILTNTEEVKALSEFIKQNNLDLNQLGDTYEHPMYHLFKLTDSSQYLNIKVEEQLKKIITEIKNFEDKEIRNDTPMYPLLKEYQKSGLKWLTTLYDLNLGGILADDMGLGKTLQVISLLESLETKELILVACPKSLVYNWENELKKFNARFPSIVYAGSREQRDELLEKMKHQDEKTLVITSYDTLRNDVEYFKEIQFNTFILDEAQHIKNITALKTKAVKEIPAKHKFVLTGTPLENAISDLWSIFDFLMPGYLYSYNKFKKIEQKATIDDQIALDFIVDKTRPFILRRTKQGVLKELPDKTEEIIYAKFDQEEKEIYDAYLLTVKEKMEQEKVNRIDFLADLIKLRQLCLSPKLIYDNYKKDSSKIELTIELIENAIHSGHKVLVFSSFVKVLNLLEKKLDPNLYYMLTGKTDAKERVEMSETFNNKESEKKVFLISLKAGGTGLNLTGADIVIHLDPWWNLAAENQATDRAHRIGQENKVTVYKMIMKDSIEEKVIQLQEKKKELFDKIIEGSEDNFAKLNESDYKFLLE